MNIRVRGPNGQNTLSGLDDSTTVIDFLKQLQTVTGVAVEQQQLLSGFPPQVIALPGDLASQTLADLKLAAGDVVTVRVDSSRVSNPVINKPADQDGHATVVRGTEQTHQPQALDENDEELARALAASLADVAPPAAATAAPHASQQQQPQSSQGAVDLAVPMPDGSVMTRRVIDSDNSCLFNAVGYVMEHSRRRAATLRQVIADAVLADPLTYTAGFLGKEPEEYCAWIKDPQRWGGAIELSILARHYQREIAAFDIHTKRCDLYGQDAGYHERVLLLYDGLHYDALAAAAFQGADEDLDVTILQVGSTSCEAAMESAKALVSKAHDAKQYTDTASFTLRCGVCYMGVKGEKEAVEHANATGHQNFTEYN